MGGGASAAKSSFRVVVAGDSGTGKSTLISSAVAAEGTKTYDDPLVMLADVPAVLGPTQFPEDTCRARPPITVVDTSSSLQDREKLDDELKRADAIVLTYSCDQPPTPDVDHPLCTFWLPHIQGLQEKVPVIVAGCKLDIRKPVDMKKVMSPIMEQFPQVDFYFECSAKDPATTHFIFQYAQKAVLYPTAPLFDWITRTLKPRCLGALKRIFILCDLDGDNALSDAEFNDLRVKCFADPWEESKIAVVRSLVQPKCLRGVDENGFTLQGFLSFCASSTKTHPKSTWAILKKFGYDNDIRYCNDQLAPPIKRTPDQSVELTSEALEFLTRVFSLFDMDGDGVVNAKELEDVFSNSPESPWSEAPFADIFPLGRLSVDEFLSKWAFITLLNPVLSVKNLKYIGYVGDSSSAVKVTRSRRVDQKKRQSDRNVFQCFVFGPKEAGKSSLLHALGERPFSQVYTPTIKGYTVNSVCHHDGTRKTLIFREIPEDAVENLLIHKDALAACDIAVFVHDSSNESSWTKATMFLVQIANHGESTGYEFPCLMVAAKGDLKSYPTAKQDSTRVSKDLGIDAPIRTWLGDFNGVYRRIVRATEQPHLSIPETNYRKTRKQYHTIGP